MFLRWPELMQDLSGDFGLCLIVLSSFLLSTCTTACTASPIASSSRALVGSRCEPGPWLLWPRCWWLQLVWSAPRGAPRRGWWSPTGQRTTAGTGTTWRSTSGFNTRPYIFTSQPSIDSSWFYNYLPIPDAYYKNTWWCHFNDTGADM